MYLYTAHISSHGGLQFLLKGNQINIKSLIHHKVTKSSSVRNFHVLVDNIHFSAVLDIHKRDHRLSCLIKTKETFGKRKESQRLTNKVPVETLLLWERIELQ